MKEEAQLEFQRTLDDINKDKQDWATWHFKHVIGVCAGCYDLVEHEVG